jgi:hypothetical protein
MERHLGAKPTRNNPVPTVLESANDVRERLIVWWSEHHRRKPVELHKSGSEARRGRHSEK